MRENFSALENDWKTCTLPRCRFLVQHRFFQYWKASKIGWTIWQNFTGRRHLHVNIVQSLIKEPLGFTCQDAGLIMSRTNHILATVSFSVNKMRNRRVQALFRRIDINVLRWAASTYLSILIRQSNNFK